MVSQMASGKPAEVVERALVAEDLGLEPEVLVVEVEEAQEAGVEVAVEGVLAEVAVAEVLGVQVALVETNENNQEKIYVNQAGIHMHWYHLKNSFTAPIQI